MPQLDITTATRKERESATYELDKLTPYNILDQIDGLGVWILNFAKHEHLPTITTNECLFESWKDKLIEPFGISPVYICSPWLLLR